MSLQHLASLVKEMRQYQKKYFRTHETYWLNLAKASENHVDSLVDEILNPPESDLFGQELKDTREGD
jgi:hypothetical protein